jgi:hypothetical protein
MIYIAWVLSLAIAFTGGYYSKVVVKRVEVLEETVKSKIDKPVIEEPKSQVIDPYDEVQTAIYERDKLMKKLNPNA